VLKVFRVFGKLRFLAERRVTGILSFFEAGFRDGLALRNMKTLVELAFVGGLNIYGH